MTNNADKLDKLRDRAKRAQHAMDRALAALERYYIQAGHEPCRAEVMAQNDLA